VLFIYLFIYLLIYLFIYLFTCIFTYLFIYLFICLFICAKRIYCNLITPQRYPVVDGGEEVVVTVEIQTVCSRGQFFLVAVFLVVEDIALDLQLVVVHVTKLVDHVQHVQSCQTRHTQIITRPPTQGAY